MADLQSRDHRYRIPQFNCIIVEGPGTYDQVEITEDDCYDELGFPFHHGKSG